MHDQKGVRTENRGDVAAKWRSVRSALVILWMPSIFNPYKVPSPLWTSAGVYGADGRAPTEVGGWTPSGFDAMKVPWRRFYKAVS